MRPDPLGEKGAAATCRIGGHLYQSVVGHITGAALMSCAVAANADAIENTYAEHTRAVELARAGEPAAGLALLRPLLARFPNDYPLNRDAILIATWADDCDYAIERFAYVRGVGRLDSYLIEPLAECGARKAQAGDHETGIALLRALLPHAHDTYPLRRDLALMQAWNRDCAGALDDFQPIRDDARNPPYLTVPMVDCLVREARPQEAQSVIERAIARDPQHDELLGAALRVEVARRLGDGYDPEAISLRGGIETDESQPGPREWRTQWRLDMPLARSVRGHVRALATAASGEDPGPFSGDLRRAAIGLGWHPSARWEFTQEFSTDVRRADQGGAATRIDYRPYQTLAWEAMYTTFAEDLPLRARLNRIEATHAMLGAAYHTLDYLWEGRASVNRYEFTDGNRRDSAYGEIGYAYHRLPKWEQRIVLEAFRSRNTLTGAAYFNPSEDRSLGLTHRTVFVFDSRYKRHVDTLSISAGEYRQEGFDGKPRFGVRYQQDYDFDDDLALSWALGWQRNVYDGEHESAVRAEIYVRRRF